MLPGGLWARGHWLLFQLLLRPLGILVSRPLGFALRCAIYSHLLYFLLDCCCFQFFKRFREGAPWPSVTYITSVFPDPSIDEQFRHTAGVFFTQSHRRSYLENFWLGVNRVPHTDGGGLSSGIYSSTHILRYFCPVREGASQGFQSEPRSFVCPPEAFTTSSVRGPAFSPARFCVCLSGRSQEVSSCGYQCCTSTLNIFFN